MHPPPLDLLIVGAGPVGLSTAVAALHRGAKRVLVVEQARALRPVGRGLDLLPNCMRTLSALAPPLHDLLKPFIRHPPPGKVRSVYVSASGSLLDSGDVQKYGELASLGWWQLQRILLEALPDGEFLVLNHRLVDLVQEPNNGLVRAEFIADRPRKGELRNWTWNAGDDGGDDGLIVDSVASQGSCSGLFQKSETGKTGSSSGDEGGERVKCWAKMVVGADGINSVARECIYRDSGPEWEPYAKGMYSGFISLLAKGSTDMSEEDDRILQDLYMKNGVMSILTCDKEKTSPSSFRGLLVRVPKQEKMPVTWITMFTISVDEATAKTSSPRRLVQIALDRARESNFADALINFAKEVWNATPEEDISILRFHTVPATHPPPFDPLPFMPRIEFPSDFYRPWYHRRVVLVGDALHGGPNFLAQGVAMGIEDAYELVTRLADSGMWSGDGGGTLDDEGVTELFERYRQARLERVCFYQRRSMNRISEHDVVNFDKYREVLWRYDPAVNTQ